MHGHRDPCKPMCMHPNLPCIRACIHGRFTHMNTHHLHLIHRVVSTVGTIDEQNTPFHVVKTLLSRLLGIDRTKTIHDREQIILDHVTTDEQHELLPLLNDLLMMKVRTAPRGGDAPCYPIMLLVLALSGVSSTLRPAPPPT